MNTKFLSDLIEEKCIIANLENNFRFLADKNQDNWSDFEVFKYLRKGRKIILFYNYSSSHSEQYASSYLDNLLSHIISGNQIQNATIHRIPIEIEKKLILNGLHAFFNYKSAETHINVFGRESFERYIASHFEEYDKRYKSLVEKEEIDVAETHMGLHSYLPLCSDIVLSENQEFRNKNALMSYFTMFAELIGRIEQNASLPDDEKLKLSEIIGIYSGCWCKLIPSLTENRIIEFRNPDSHWVHWNLLNKDYITPESFMFCSKLYVDANRFLTENFSRE